MSTMWKCSHRSETRARTHCFLLCQCSGGSRIFLRAPTFKVGVLTYHFAKKLHENERIWTPRERVLGAPWVRQCSTFPCSNPSPGSAQREEAISCTHYTETGNGTVDLTHFPGFGPGPGLIPGPEQCVRYSCFLKF